MRKVYLSTLTGAIIAYSVTYVAKNHDSPKAQMT